MPDTKQTTGQTTGTIKSEKLRIGGMDCADCAMSIERSLRTMPGVESAGVNFAAATADVRYDPDAVSRQEMFKRISDLGYYAEAAGTRTSLGPSSDELQFSIEGMDCGDCARTVEKVVAGL